MYREVKRGTKNRDIRCFGGCVSKSEFQRRIEFIRKRIALGYSQEEIAFLIGRYPRLIRDYEEMAARVRPGGADIAVLSEVMGEDVSALFPPEGDDVLRWKVSGTRIERKIVTYYEMTLETHEKPTPKFKAKERPLKVFDDRDEHSHVLGEIVLQRMLDGNYFLSSKSALEILSSFHKALVPKIRPIILKHAIHRLVADGQICCFQNSLAQLRYHKRMN